MITPAPYNFTIFGGASFDLTMTWKDVNNVVIPLAGYSAAMQIRLNPGSPVLVNLRSTVAGGIVLANVSPTIVITIAPSATSALTFPKAHYDLLLTDSAGVVTRLIYGVVTFSPAVTIL